MEYEYTISLAEAEKQLKNYIINSGSGEDVDKAIEDLRHNEDGGGYLSPSKCMFNNNDGTVDVIEVCFGIVELDKKGNIVRQMTGSEAYDVLMLSREWLEENPEADVRIFELKEGWDSLKTDSMLDASKVIRSSCDASKTPIIVGINYVYDKKKNIVEEVIGCVFSLNDCKIINEWCNESGLTYQLYKFNGTLKDFLTKNDHRDFWFDYVEGEFQI